MASAARKPHLEPVAEDDNNADKARGTDQSPEPDASNEVAAVKGEVLEGNAKTVEWESLTFALPPEMPAVALMDRADMESSNDSGAIIRLLRTVLGPEQFMAARNRVVEISNSDMSDQIEKITDLIGAVMNAYGTDEGKSEGPSA
jgi:hypothetical protein